MTDIMAELLKYIIKNMDLFVPFILFGFCFFVAMGAAACYLSDKEKENENKVAISFFRFLAIAFIVVGVSICLIKVRANDMVRYLQYTNTYLSVKSPYDVYSAIGELDTQTFILLNEKAKKHTEGQRKIKSEAEREAEREAELKEKERILNIKKEIEEKVKK